MNAAPALATGTGVVATPGVAQLFGHAADEIASAAAGLWPGRGFAFGEQVPSVTCYVRRVVVGDRQMYAKYSYLGASLVSVLAGTFGGWASVRAAQGVYLAGSGSLLAREAAQLDVLRRLGGLRTCRLVGYRRGVLFTETEPGMSLARLLATEPWRTAELLGRTWVELRGLHGAELAHRLPPATDLGERGILGTFTRRFTNSSAKAYLDGLVARGGDTGPWSARTTLPARRVVARLRRLWLAHPLTTDQLVVVYGDLKPEHVLFGDGCAAAGERPVLLDPALMSGPVTVDLAKLISRTMLLLISAPAGSLTAATLTAGLIDFVDHLAAASVREESRVSWWRELVMLWLTDMVNIATTYLFAPAELPLPPHAVTVVRHARTVWRLLDQLSAELDAGTDPHTVWKLGLTLANPPAPLP